MSARNAYKGYSYQNWVTFCLVQKMDLRKEIVQIDSEINVHDNFDDIYIKTKNEEFYCQVKNWKNADINEVKITDKKIKFKDYDPIEYTPNKNNIVILNKDFETDTEILGIKAKLINSIYFVPLTENNKENQIEHYIDINRKDQIESIFDDRTINGHFKICLKDLPELKSFSTELKEETILLNEIVDEIERGTKWVIGEPGIGKSHIVTEYENKFEDLIIYRFYTNSFDNDYDDRLEYENFIKDLIYKVFKTPEKHTEEELIQQLKKIDKPIIIDGLDHVENYRSRELKKYFNFIKKLTNLRVLIFSRPLLDFPENIQISHLEKWTKNQTMYYLKEKYSFNNRIKDKIYQIASGYPIITYYLSEHVKNGGSFNDYGKIETITDYYDKIMEGVKTKSALSLFDN